MKRAVLLGCSHAAGNEMSLQSDLEFKDQDEIDCYEANNSYAALIAKDLGYSPLNYAITGGSNDAMFRTFLALLPGLTDRDLVIACWTGADRCEVYSEKDHTWIGIAAQSYPQRLSPGQWLLSGRPGKISNDSMMIDQFSKAWFANWGEKAGRLSKAKNIIALNALACQNKIKVINLDSFWSIGNGIKIDQMWTATRSCYYWPTDQTFLHWCDKFGFAHTNKIHYFFDAHRSYANHVLENIRSQDYLSND